MYDVVTVTAVLLWQLINKMTDDEALSLELEAQGSEPQLEAELSGNELEGDGESDGNGGEAGFALSYGSQLDSEMATGDSRTSMGRGGGDYLMDNLSETSDGGWDTDLDTEEEKEVYDPTGGAAYRKCCDLLGIVPVSHFLRDLQAKNSVIGLQHHGLGSKGTKAIAAALTSNTCVTHLDLSDCGLGTEGGVAIMSMLKENCYITHLDLSDNSLEPTGAFAIASMLESNNTVTHLSLRGNAFNDKAAEPISEVIRTSFQLSYLDLSHNEFGEAAGILLGEALGESEVLQTLNLSWNRIRKKGALALATGLKGNQMLKVLNLSHNGLGDEGAVAFADALKLNTTLTELDISNNRFSSATATTFAAKVLPTCETLKILKMGKNSMQRIITPKEDHSQLPEPATEVEALLDAAAASPSLLTLDLSGFTFTLAMADKVAEMKETRPSLTIVYGGTGGYTRVKPLAPPLEKLIKYATESSLSLENLFRSFDKEQRGHLLEEDFRNSLQHIQAPLLEFERQLLIKTFSKTVPPAEEGGEELVAIDYHALIELSGTDNKQPRR